jgi:SAM-dependent methyltransferase
MDHLEHNSRAWDVQVERGNEWTVPASPEQVAAARAGQPRVLLTPTRPVPAAWLEPLAGADLLCLASAGGQQGPILAAAGARVTVLDNSPRQLEQDRRIAEREALDLRLERGTMTDLSRFEDESFDLVFHPVSNVFIPDVLPVWRECHRVLRTKGRLLAGITNPVLYIFDPDAEKRGELHVTASVPYSDLESRSGAELQALLEQGEPLEFGHTLEDQLGGQLAAGFALVGLYEDRQPDGTLDRFIPTFIATRALKAS